MPALKSDHNASAPLWLFDLDNTLHDASQSILPAISAAMNAYLARVMDGASAEEVDRTRSRYLERYGATLLGLMRHHAVRADDFLRETHALPALAEMIAYERGLARLLLRLPGRKILLTNAPLRYSSDVMRHLGLGRHFSHHVAIEQMRVHGQLRPKPSRLMLRRLLRKHGASARRTILVEDSLANLQAAKALGMRTVWVTQYLPAGTKRPAYVDVKVKSVRQLPRYLDRLR
ncbi:MAG: pyrimidine 5'-nucleotidase [Pseudomonadota bacterium]